MPRASYGSAFTVAIALLIAGWLLAQDAPRPQRKVALVVGVTKYLHDFEDLKYADREATALADELRAGGFDEVVVLTDKPEWENPATKANILASVKKLL